MSGDRSVECIVSGLRSRYRPQSICFDVDTELEVLVEGELGPAGVSEVAADLLHIAATVSEIERQLRGRQNTNPPARFELHMKLRRPAAWSEQAIKAVSDILHLLGNAEWKLDFAPSYARKIPEHQCQQSGSATQVALFSGGVDSTCGIATLGQEAARTRLVSYYSPNAAGQKGGQRAIATGLGFGASLSQWRLAWNHRPGRGHTFRYRSFLFLALAAVVAESWEARTIYQFENGVLATSIPPATSWMMTKHAHPRLHQNMVALLEALFGGQWAITNPFLPHTKRECVEELVKTVGEQQATQLLQQTTTCWFHRANRIVGGTKRPNVACGVCIPCIVRRTACRGGHYAYDIMKDAERNHRQRGVAFRSYYGFLERVISGGESPSQFYKLLPAAGRDLLGGASPLELEALHRLFTTFADEFMETYCVEPIAGGEMEGAMLHVPALSIRQPWAELILRGQKSIEIRTWSTDYRGLLWVHTGVKGSPQLEEAFGLSGLFRGGFVGSVELSAVVPFDEQRWNSWRSKHLDQGDFHPGFYAWILSSPRRFAAPIQAPGDRYLFYPSAELQAQLQDANLDADRS